MRPDVQRGCACARWSIAVAVARFVARRRTGATRRDDDDDGGGDDDDYCYDGVAQNWGYTTYLDRLFSMRCFEDLVRLRLFPGAKDMSESMGALQGG